LSALHLSQLFIILGWSIYHYFTNGRTESALIIPILSAIAFILLTKTDSKFLKHIDHLKALIDCNKQELDYLNGDLTELDKGEIFANPAHPYSNDLDIFGDESLFQIINRTVTPNGASRMAEMLLNPCLEKSEIENRQNATGELISKVNWYQNFMVSGKTAALHQPIS